MLIVTLASPAQGLAVSCRHICYLCVLNNLLQRTVKIPLTVPAC